MRPHTYQIRQEIKKISASLRKNPPQEEAKALEMEKETLVRMLPRYDTNNLKR